MAVWHSQTTLAKRTPRTRSSPKFNNSTHDRSLCSSNPRGDVTPERLSHHLGALNRPSDVKNTLRVQKTPSSAPTQAPGSPSHAIPQCATASGARAARVEPQQRASTRQHSTHGRCHQQRCADLTTLAKASAALGGAGPASHKPYTSSACASSTRTRRATHKIGSTVSGLSATA